VWGKYDYSTLANGGALSEERIVGPAIKYLFLLFVFVVAKALVAKAPHSILTHYSESFSSSELNKEPDYCRLWKIQVKAAYSNLIIILLDDMVACSKSGIQQSY
jgi:hypothetical protein